jgi:AcrR family transcriptional regulator
MVKKRRKVRKAEARPRDAAETRRRILEAAKVQFSRAGYDQVGLREIAADVAVDPALIARYFGSKEQLFRAVAARAFGVEELMVGPPKAWGLAIARHLMRPVEGSSWTAGFDPFQLLLRSAVSPAAAPIIAQELHDGFVRPFAARLAGPDAEIRAALATSCILGFALLRVALGSPAVASADAEHVTTLLAKAIQREIDGGPKKK